MTSTSRSTGTGLKKCIPMTCSGRFVAMASLMIGIDEVLVAKIAWGSLDDRVEAAGRPRSFRSSSSATASITSSRSLSVAKSSLKLRLPRARLASSSGNLPDGHRPLQGAFDPGLALGEGVGVALDHHDVGAGARTDLGDARTHQSTPDHANSFHASLLFGEAGLRDGKVYVRGRNSPKSRLTGGEYDWRDLNLRREPY